MTGWEPTAAALLEVLRREGLDTVEGAFAYSGGEDLVKPGLAQRRRTRIALTDADGVSHVLYLKRYGQEPLLRRCVRRLSRPPALSPAETEFRAICALQRAGIPTMQAVCFGHEWGAWGARRSYVIVARVPGEALERCGASLLEALRTRPGSRGDFTRRLAHLVRTFHETGFVHRDLYASHIFVDPSTDPISLHLIDLARAFRPWLRRFRWRVKDLAQLKFSAPEPWVRADWRAFLRLYLGPGGTRSLSGLDRAVDAKVASICRRRERKRRREGAKRA